jgi:hypothetical protein
MSTAPSVIEIQVESISQLFNTFDPTPFRDRDLDREAEEHIVTWARELPRHAPLAILIHLPVSETASAHAKDLNQALSRYFNYRVEVATSDLKELFRVGRYSLMVGLLVLVACLTLGRLLRETFPKGEIGRFLNEGLVILGWVANWRPIEIFLYEWWPIVRRRNLFRRLGRASITVSARPE